jgi:hypothetical protein
MMAYPEYEYHTGAKAKEWYANQIASLFARQVDRRRLCGAIGITLGAAAGLVAHDQASGRRRKTAPAAPSSSSLLQDTGAGDNN